jgi:DNA-binding MarR family transcriptional regulator
MICNVHRLGYDRSMLGSDRAGTQAEAAGQSWGAALSSQTSFLLARANARSLYLGNAALAPLGLKLRSYSVLALAVGDERPSQRDLATFLRLDPSQVVSLVDDLQARGLVDRVADPRDRRANEVVASAAGYRLAAQAERILTTVEDQVFEGLDDDERATLAALLRNVAFWD